MPALLFKIVPTGKLGFWSIVNFTKPWDSGSLLVESGRLIPGKENWMTPFPIEVNSYGWLEAPGRSVPN